MINRFNRCDGGLSGVRGQALVELLDEEEIKIPSLICFSSVDGERLSSGESFADCLEIMNKSEKVAAVGLNCTPPQFMEHLICLFKKVRGGGGAALQDSSDICSSTLPRGPD